MRRLSFLIAVSGLLYAQINTPALQNQIAQDLVKFKSNDWSQRYAAFADLTSIRCSTCGPSIQILDGIENTIHSGAVTHDEMAAQLIGLLKKEADYDKEIRQRFEATNVSLAPPGYYDYLGDLVMAVVHMRDPRSLDALFDFLDSGNMATDAIASFGDPALKQTLNELDSPGSARMPSVTPESRRQSAYSVLSRMVEAKNLQKFSDPVSARAIIKDRLLAGVTGPEGVWSRLQAVEGLGKLGDRDLISVLKTLAETDSTSDPQGRDRYLVREAAQQALTAMKATTKQ